MHHTVISLEGGLRVNVETKEGRFIEREGESLCERMREGEVCVGVTGGVGVC